MASDYGNYGQRLEENTAADNRRADAEKLRIGAPIYDTALRPRLPPSSRGVIGGLGLDVPTDLSRAQTGRTSTLQCVEIRVDLSKPMSAVQPAGEHAE